MEQAVKDALEGSIKKWEAIVDGTGYDDGVDNCPLCKLFYRLGRLNQCAGCPVSRRTGASLCKNTPYGSFAIICEKGATIHSLGPVNKIAAIAAAQAELEFLKSLREQI